MSTIVDQAVCHAKSDNTGDINSSQSSVGEPASRGSFEPRSNSKQDSICEDDPLGQGTVTGFSTHTAAIRQDGGLNIQTATLLGFAIMQSLQTYTERSPCKRQANLGDLVDIADWDDVSLGRGRPSSISAHLQILDDTSKLSDSLSKEVVPFDDPPKSQPGSGPRHSLFRHAMGLCNPFEREKPGFLRNIIDVVSSHLDTSFGTILSTPLTSLSNQRVMHRRQSTGIRSLVSVTRLLASIFVLTSVMSPATASPLHQAEGSLSTNPATPIGLYIACAITVVVAIIVCSLTLRYKLFNISWRNCLGTLSLVCSIVWTCLVHWDQAPEFRTFVLALCHGLIYNFTLQLSMGSHGRLLPEAWAINLGFPVAALLLEFLVAPNGKEATPLPSGIADLIWSGFLRWATSPLQFTSWAILVKVAFYTCDVIINRHSLPAPTTLWGRGVVKIVSFVERLYGRVFPTAQQHRADQGSITAAGHNTVAEDNDIELGDRAQNLAFDQDGQTNGNDQTSPADISSPRTWS